MSHPRARLTPMAALAVVAGGLFVLPAPAVAAPANHLVINEVYGGGGSTSPSAAFKADFVELYNPTDAPVSLGGMSLQYRAATYTSGNVTSLELPNDSVAPGSHYLVQVSNPNSCSGNPCGGADLPDVNFSATSTFLSMAAGAGQVILAQGTTGITAVGSTMHHVAGVVDFVGFGTTPTSFETARTGTALANTTSISRTVLGEDSDNNSADFAPPAAPTPRGGDVVAQPLSATDPGDKTFHAGQPIAPLTLAAGGGTAPYTWAVDQLPSGLTLTDGVISGTPDTVGTTTVTATVTDSAAPTPATATVAFDITIDPELVVRTIAEVQGNGSRSPYAPATGTGNGEVVVVEGVVTGVYADVSWAGNNAGGFDGFYIQTGGTGGTSDATPDASDAVFVYGSQHVGTVAIGDSVRVTGPVVEFNGGTQISPAAGGVVDLDTPLPAVTGLEVAYPTTEEGREAHEGMLLAPTDTFTVTNSYSTNQYAEVGLATGTTPLKQPTEYVAPDDAAGIAAIREENSARGVVLDDGTSINYMGNQTIKAQPIPYLTNADGSANAVRVGARATLNQPVILEYRNNTWKFQPTSPVFTNGADVVTFSDTRADNLVPQNVGGDLKIATFNVLNYFNTTGEAYAAAGAQQNPPLDTFCTYYTDRQSNRIGNNSCGVRLLDDPSTPANEANTNDGRGPRGAATQASLERQEAKLVHTINALGADILGLEEMENSIKLPGETNRDDALAHLVDLLNAAEPNTWAYVKSPGEALTSAAIAEQDVIRGAFIYKVDRVATVGQSDILFGTDEFANAREPLAQAFKAKGAPDSDAFAVIVNHFKSKGDNQSPAPPATGDNANDTETGVGAFNGDRTRQATRLVQFADEFAEDRGLEAVFLAGDFNSYSKEEPIEILRAGGYELVDSDQSGDESYSYQGLSGSLDHVLANAAAHAMVTGADIWEINANESIAYQYSRYNYNVTDFWQPNLPFATSDHNPEIVGIDVPDFTPKTYKEIQVLATNDFHGRLLPDAGNAAGAAPFASAVKELEAENPNTVFAAAGDLVGASTFESFIQDDEPTIDALNAMGLDVSAAGNHEFDRGYSDFVGRIQSRADWDYIAANVVEPDGRNDLAETYSATIDGVNVGFVGAVTEDLPALVAPGMLEGATVTDVVDATNAAAADLKAAGADLVILLVHEGANSTQCRSDVFTDSSTVFGNIAQNTSADVDAIVSGHTHLAYNCRFPVAEWASEGRTVTRRPVVSAGQYGTNLNKLVFKYDTATEELAAIDQDVVATAGVGYAADPAVQDIVDDAVAYANIQGAVELGVMDAEANRAVYGSGLENRGGESTLGNVVAEAQRWSADTDIAFMNPGGLRADMPGSAAGALRSLSYREAADVQPFANTIVKMDLTGAQIKKVLEQQWQRTKIGGVPSRPFLRLGVSEGFTYTYVESPVTVTGIPNQADVNTFAGEVTGMWLNGQPIDEAATYSVAANSFLGSGGDNFWELANGANTVDTGKVDLQGMVDFMAQYDTANPLHVDQSQRGVEVKFPASAPATYAPGDTVAFDVSSWSMSTTADAKDTAIDVQLNGVSIGSATLDNALPNTPYDTVGKASVSVQLPESTPLGGVTLELVGATTGTRIPVALEVPKAPATVTAPDVTSPINQVVEITATVPADATGTVEVRDSNRSLGTAAVVDGQAVIELHDHALPAGTSTLTLLYSGDAQYEAATGSVDVTLNKVAPDEFGTPDVTAVKGDLVTVVVDVAVGSSGTVEIRHGDAVLGSGSVMGNTTITFPTSSLPLGATELDLTYSGDGFFLPATGSFTVTLTAPNPGTVKKDSALTVTDQSLTYGTPATFTVGVTAGATGSVELRHGAVVLGTVAITDGKAAFAYDGLSIAPGEAQLTATYAGDAAFNGSTAPFKLTIAKADSTVRAKVTPKKVKVRSTKAKVRIKVSGPDGVVATGKVTVKVKGMKKARTVTVKNGKAVVKLPKFRSKGKKFLTVTYSGDAHLLGTKVKLKVRVR